MAEMVVPSGWAVSQFGEQAASVIERVVLGLAAAQQMAWRVQAAAANEGVATRRPYGSLWDARYHAFVEALKDLDGFREYHPPGAPYRLPVVNERVLIPFRHATNLGRPIGSARLENDVPRKVSREFGAEPQPSLFDEFDGGLEARPVEVDDVPVIYVAYVANADSDRLLGAWWGEAAAMDDEGRLHWSPEKLPLDLVARSRGRRVDSGVAAAGVDSQRMFYEGVEPTLLVKARSVEVELPSAEFEPTRPDSADGDE